jgi:Ca2+-binding EF-hand superfamily protein
VLSEEETKAALQAIDKNKNGVIEFNEFVAFWVNPSKYVTELQSISEAATKESKEEEKSEKSEKEVVSSGSSN